MSKTKKNKSSISRDVWYVSTAKEVQLLRVKLRMLENEWKSSYSRLMDLLEDVVSHGYSYSYDVESDSFVIKSSKGDEVVKAHYYVMDGFPCVDLTLK